MTRPQRSLRRRFDPAGIVGAVLLVTLLAGLASGDPSTQPAKVSDQQLSAWVAGLDSRAPAVREAASSSLMLLTRDDLPQLRAALAKVQPLSSSQLQVLHDVVTHVYLTGELYNKSELGFLGMGMYQLNPFGADPRVDGQGIIVRSRMVGFAAYRSLLEGDIILSIGERPDAVLSSTEAFIDVVKVCHPGTVLHFILLRQGHQMTVPVTVDARPQEIPLLGDGRVIEEVIAQFNETRRDAAEAYWQKQFGPMISEAVSSAD